MRSSPGPTHHAGSRWLPAHQLGGKEIHHLVNQAIVQQGPGQSRPALGQKAGDSPRAQLIHEWRPDPPGPDRRRAGAAPGLRPRSGAGPGPGGRRAQQATRQPGAGPGPKPWPRRGRRRLLSTTTLRGLGLPGRRQVSWGSSVSAVPAPTIIASTQPRTRCTKRRLAPPVIQRLCPVALAVLPSMVAAVLRIT